MKSFDPNAYQIQRYLVPSSRPSAFHVQGYSRAMRYRLDQECPIKKDFMPLGSLRAIDFTRLFCAMLIVYGVERT
jgi:hypothetical protein